MIKFVFNQSGEGNTQIGSIGRGPEWVRTANRLPDGDEHDEVLSLYKGTDYLLYDIVQVGWLRLHPEMYVYWTRMPQKPEVEG